MGTAASPSYLDSPYTDLCDRVDAIVNSGTLVLEDYPGALSLINSIENFIKHLRLIDVSGVPALSQGQIRDQLQEMLHVLARLNDRQMPASGQTRGLIEELHTSFKRLFDFSSPVMIYSAISSSSLKAVAAKTAEQNSILQEMKEKYQNSFTHLETAAMAKNAMFERLIEDKKRDIRETAVEDYREFFSKEADKHDTSATHWLWAAALLGLATAVLGGLNYLVTAGVLGSTSKVLQVVRGAESASTALTIQLAVAKVILFSIFLSAAYWSARIYRSHRHNFVVNRHRSNALASFKAFVYSTDDEEIKHAVLLQTTSCIYAPQPTGFTSGGDTDGDSPLKVLEIVRNFQKNS